MILLFIIRFRSIKVEQFEHLWTLKYIFPEINFWGDADFVFLQVVPEVLPYFESFSWGCTGSVLWGAKSKLASSHPGYTKLKKQYDKCEIAPLSCDPIINV